MQGIPGNIRHSLLRCRWSKAYVFRGPYGRVSYLTRASGSRQLMKPLCYSRPDVVAKSSILCSWSLKNNVAPLSPLCLKSVWCTRSRRARSIVSMRRCGGCTELGWCRRLIDGRRPWQKKQRIPVSSQFVQISNHQWHVLSGWLILSV